MLNYAQQKVEEKAGIHVQILSICRVAHVVGEESRSSNIKIKK